MSSQLLVSALTIAHTHKHMTTQERDVVCCNYSFSVLQTKCLLDAV